MALPHMRPPPRMRLPPMLRRLGEQEPAPTIGRGKLQLRPLSVERERW